MRDPARAGDLASQPGVVVLPLDVTSEDSVSGAVSAALNRFGHIDALVNNAGYGYFSYLEQADLAEVERCYATNVFGLLRVTKAVVPHLRERRSGVVVNLSSLVGRFALPASGAYNSTKHAVEALSEALSYELALYGVRVVVIEPGFFITDFQSRSLSRNPAPADPESPYGELSERVVRRRAQMRDAAGDPEWVAEAIYRAAVDPATPFRVPVGHDAKELLGRRSDSTDEEWMGYVRSLYDLP